MPPIALVTDRAKARAARGPAKNKPAPPRKAAAKKTARAKPALKAKNTKNLPHIVKLFAEFSDDFLENGRP
jgi:hypothetical protein